jgi:LysR family glycine cleavage system transcriptional activator
MPNGNVSGHAQRSGRRDSLPPLDLLRGFHAAARHLNFSRAAEDLFVTQSAISRQISALEESLGVALFLRAHRTLVLTPQGEELFAATSDILERLRRVTARVRTPLTQERVTLTTVPGFASLWLIPRLARFADIAPLVDVRISVNHHLSDLEQDQIDLAVRYCSPRGVAGRILFEEQFLPVCAPQLMRDPKVPLASIADLAQFTFLDLAATEESAALVEWNLWLRSVDAAELRPKRTISFSQYDGVIAAALAGQGVAIGRLPIINEYLADGRLVAPFARAEASTKAYVLIESPDAKNNPAAQSFITWLLEETRR